jgi:hypothetical protein
MHTLGRLSSCSLATSLRGRLPSLRAVMTDLHIGQPKAREIRQHLASKLPQASGQEA